MHKKPKHEKHKGAISSKKNEAIKLEQEDLRQRGDTRLVDHEKDEKRWQDKIIEPEHYDWEKGEEKDWEEYK